MPQIEVAARAQEGREALEDHALGMAIEVDQHVAAEDRLERPLHRPRGFDEIEPGKAHEGVQFGADLPAAIGERFEIAVA